ncbi:hypothetical protein FACS1894219_07670 [Clostridia bacterium]|nr:hypothetical protein FACS1894219_07670 [Clostridia bacterium]
MAFKTVIQNSSTDYKRKAFRALEKEISVADFASQQKELLSVDNSSFLFEQDISYANIEDVFTNESHYRAMKRLSDKEKQVLFQTVVEEKKRNRSRRNVEYYKREHLAD